MKKAVVTGCTGMIGLALINRLLDNDYEVLALAHSSSKKIDRIPQNDRLKVMLCDLNMFEDIKNRVSEKYDIFYHLAWEGTYGNSRNDMYQQIKNIQYTIDSVQLASYLGCSTYVGAGSQAEYGRVSDIISEKTPTFPENGYGIAKLSAGHMSRIECSRLGIRHIWARIFSVYGPNDNVYTMVTNSIIKMLRNEKPSYTKAEQIWDYLFCEDAADALYLMHQYGKDGAVYCLGSGKAMPLYEYINIMKDVINPNLEIGFGEIPYSDNQVMHLCADISALTKDTGFIPITDFRTGVKKTIEWCIKEGLV